MTTLPERAKEALEPDSPWWEILVIGDDLARAVLAAEELAKAVEAHKERQSCETLAALSAYRKTTGGEA